MRSEDTTIWGGQVGLMVSFLTFHFYDPGLNHARGTTLISFSVPTMTAWVFSGMIVKGFLPTS